MYIIIIGGGKVGFSLAKELVAYNHEVLLIEIDPQRVRELQEVVPDILMEGDGCEATTLDKAGTKRADMLLAVTGDDEDNLVACQVAKQRFNVAQTIARINNPGNEEIFRKLDEVDISVSATSAIMAHIEQELPVEQLIPMMHLAAGWDLVDVRIPDSSRVVSRPVKEIMLPYQSLICLVIGEDGLPRVPTADTVLHAGDQVVAVTLRESEEALREALMAPPPPRSF